MTPDERLDRAYTALAQLNQCTVKGHGVAAGERARWQAEHRAAMKAWLGLPDVPGVSYAVLRDATRDTYKLAICQVALGEACPAAHYTHKGASMGTNADYDQLDAAYTLVDRIKDTRGMGASTDAAEAAVAVLRDIEAGRAIVTKDAGQVRAVYREKAAGASPMLLAKLRALLAAGVTEAAIAAVLDQAIAQRGAAGQVKDDQKIATLKQLGAASAPRLYAAQPERVATKADAQLAQSATIYDDSGRPLARRLR